MLLASVGTTQLDPKLWEIADTLDLMVGSKDLVGEAAHASSFVVMSADLNSDDARFASKINMWQTQHLAIKKHVLALHAALASQASEWSDILAGVVMPAPAELPTIMGAKFDEAICKVVESHIEHCFSMLTSETTPRSVKDGTSMLDKQVSSHLLRAHLMDAQKCLSNLVGVADDCVRRLHKIQTMTLQTQTAHAIKAAVEHFMSEAGDPTKEDWARLKDAVLTVTAKIDDPVTMCVLFWDLERLSEKVVRGMMPDDAEAHTIRHTTARDLQKCMAEDVADERFLQDVKCTQALHRMKEFETSWLALCDNLDDRLDNEGSDTILLSWKATLYQLRQVLLDCKAADIAKMPVTLDSHEATTGDRITHGGPTVRRHYCVSQRSDGSLGCSTVACRSCSAGIGTCSLISHRPYG